MSKNEKVVYTSDQNWKNTALCIAVAIGIIAGAVGIVVASIALSNTKTDNSKEQYRHVFCIDAYDRLGGDVLTQLHARAVVNTHSNTLCLKGLWTRDPVNCTELLEIDVRGPVNVNETLDASYVIGSFDGVASTNETGEVDVCFHLSPTNARRLLANPSLVYIEMAMGGGSCEDATIRDYFTSVCQDSSFKVAHVDASDDDTDTEDYDYVSSSDVISDGSSSDETDMARRARVSHHAGGSLKTAAAAKATAAAAAKAVAYKHHHGRGG